MPNPEDLTTMTEAERDAALDAARLALLVLLDNNQE